MITGILAGATLVSCARHAPKSTVDMVIPPKCLTSPIIGKDCSASESVEHCKLFLVKFKPNCEQIVVKP